MDFLYTIDEFATEPVMLLNKHIGFDEELGLGIIGPQFEQELFALDCGRYGAKKCIKIYINSIGGSVIQGMSIYNAILRTNTQVDTYNTGIAASSAAVIFQAGSNRIIADYAKLMYHNPQTTGDSYANEELAVMKDALVKMVATRSGKDEDEIADMMDHITWMNADEAVQSGFADSKQTSADCNRKTLLSVTDINDLWMAGNEIINQFIDQPNTKPMLKVTNRLGLNADASEDSILQKITAIENKVREAETRLADMQNKLLVAENKLATVEHEKKEAERATGRQAALHMVKAFAETGRIKNDEATIAKWVDLAEGDHEGTEILLSELPLNRQSPRIALPADIDSPQMYNMAVQMAMIAGKNK